MAIRCTAKVTKHGERCAADPTYPRVRVLLQASPLRDVLSAALEVRIEERTRKVEARTGTRAHPGTDARHGGTNDSTCGNHSVFAEGAPFGG